MLMLLVPLSTPGMGLFIHTFPFGGQKEIPSRPIGDTWR